MEIKPIESLQKLRNNLEAQATTLASSLDYLQIFVEYVRNLEIAYNKINTELTELKKGTNDVTPEAETVQDAIGAAIP